MDSTDDDYSSIRSQEQYSLASSLNNSVQVLITNVYEHNPGSQRELFDLVSAMKQVIRTVLSDKTATLSRVSCYRVLRRFAEAKLDVKRLKAELSQSREEVERAQAEKDELLANKSMAERRISELGSFTVLSEDKMSELRSMVADLEDVSQRRSELFQRTLQEKDEVIQKLKADLEAKEKETLDMIEREERIRELEEQVNLLSAATVVGNGVHHNAKVASQNGMRPEEEASERMEDLLYDDGKDGDELQRSSVGELVQKFEERAKTHAAEGSSEPQPTASAMVVPVPISPESKSRSSNAMARELEQERKERQSLQAQLKDLSMELENVKAERDSLKENVGSMSGSKELERLKTELTESEKKLSDANERIEMLERFVVEEAHPPADIVASIAASKPVGMPVISESDDDSEVVVPIVDNTEELARLKEENEKLKDDITKLRKELMISKATVSDLEYAQKHGRAKVTELKKLAQVRGDSEAKKLLEDKAMECAELTAMKEHLEQKLRVSEANVNKLERECETTKKLADELSHSWDQALSKDENVARLQQDREESMRELAEVRIDLAECRTKLDMVMEQLKFESRRNTEALRDVSQSSRVMRDISQSSKGMRDMSHSSKIMRDFSQQSQASTTSQSGRKNKFSLSSLYALRPGANDADNQLSDEEMDLSSSRGGIAQRFAAHFKGDDGGMQDESFRRMEKRITELEGQNAAYEATVSALKHEMEKKQEKV